MSTSSATTPSTLTSLISTSTQVPGSTRSPRCLPSLDLVSVHGKRSTPSPRARRPLPAIPAPPCSAPPRHSPCRSPAVRPLPSPPRTAPATTTSTPVILDSAAPLTRRKAAIVSSPPSYHTSRPSPDELCNPWPRTPEKAASTPLYDASLLNPWPENARIVLEDVLYPSLSTQVTPPIICIDPTPEILHVPEITPSPSEILDISFSSPVLPELSFVDTLSDEKSSISDDAFSVPRPPLRAPPRPALPTLVTKNLDFLKADPSEVSLSPYSPTYPVPPTPQTLNRKRLRKLRRFLGESLPAEAVYAPLPYSQPGNAKEKLFQDIAFRRGGDITDTTNKYARAAIIVSKILDISSNDRDDSDDESNNGAEWMVDDKCSTGQYTTGTKEDYSWVLEDGMAFKAAAKRFSRKWLHEKGQNRWEEPDYQNVINALRSL